MVEKVMVYRTHIDQSGYAKLLIRIPSDTKQMLSKAAEINESMLTVLVMNSARDKAREILQAHQLFELSEADWQSFMHSLEKPPEPNDYLVAAWDDSHKENAG